MSELSSKQCVPCRGGVPPLRGEEVTKLENQLTGWKVVNEHHLQKSYSFKDFREAQAFVSRVGGLAEETRASSGHLFWMGPCRDHDLDS
jgi:4a-hydroxytetrahydrobiopterin dehydratase